MRIKWKVRFNEFKSILHKIGMKNIVDALFICLIFGACFAVDLRLHNNLPLCTIGGLCFLVLSNS